MMLANYQSGRNSTPSVFYWELQGCYCGVKVNGAFDADIC